jgi:hypothetical protein
MDYDTTFFKVSQLIIKRNKTKKKKNQTSTY